MLPMWLGSGVLHTVSGAAVGDYDNDGDIDLYVTNFGEDQLYRNNGDNTFTDITTHAPGWQSELGHELRLCRCG